MADVPHVYADAVQLGVGAFTVSLTFSIAPIAQPGTQAPEAVAVVRMSPEHAKLMAILLRKQLKQFEENLGAPIAILPQVYQQLGISAKEDW